MGGRRCACCCLDARLAQRSRGGHSTPAFFFCMQSLHRRARRHKQKRIIHAWANLIVCVSLGANARCITTLQPSAIVTNHIGARGCRSQTPVKPSCSYAASCGSVGCVDATWGTKKHLNEKRAHCQRGAATHPIVCGCVWLSCCLCVCLCVVVCLGLVQRRPAIAKEEELNLCMSPCPMS